MDRVNRRRFLSGLAAGGVACALARTPQAAYAAGLHAQAALADYKALVCVFLLGGNDSFNMLVPRSEAEYAAYARSRQNLAVPRESLLPLTPLQPDADGMQFGLHPALAELATLFEQDEACAFVANIGPLIEPTTRAQFEARTVQLPPQLFSHNDQQDQWHALNGRADATSGWAGRIADALAASTGGQTVPVSLSLSGQTLFLAGQRTVPYVMGNDGPVPFFGLEGTDASSIARRAAFERILALREPTVYGRGFAAVQQRALTASATVDGALAAVRPPNAAAFGVAFPASPLGTQLRTVAELIAVRERLEASRQIFFVATGGFDTHDDQVQDQPGLFANVSRCLHAFHRATQEMGVAANVTTFTQSDFGRTLTSNGDGTDHAWGGVQLVVGGAVRGREIYGRYPVLEIGAVQDVGGGRMIPTVSSDQYAATLARWLGVSDAALATVAPHIANFAQRDLGFLV